MTPPTHPGGLVDQVDSEIKNMEYSYKIRKAQTRKSQEGQDDQDVSVKGIDLNVGSDMNNGRVDGRIKDMAYDICDLV